MKFRNRMASRTFDELSNGDLFLTSLRKQPLVALKGFFPGDKSEWVVVFNHPDANGLPGLYSPAVIGSDALLHIPLARFETILDLNSYQIGRPQDTLGHMVMDGQATSLIVLMNGRDVAKVNVETGILVHGDGGTKPVYIQSWRILVPTVLGPKILFERAQE